MLHKYGARLTRSPSITRSFARCTLSSESSGEQRRISYSFQHQMPPFHRRLRTPLLAFTVASSFAFAACSDDGAGETPPGVEDAGDSPDVLPPPAPDGGYDCAALNCDDGNVCTIDACDVSRGCTNTPRDGAVTFEPSPATFAIVDGVAPPPMTFKAFDGDVDVTECVAWSVDDASLGTLDGTTFTPNDSFGGETDVHAKLGSSTSTMRLSVFAKMTANTGSLSNEQRTALDAPSSTVDPSVTITYPEKETVFPLDVVAPEIHLATGLATDVYRVQLKSRYFEAIDYIAPANVKPEFQVAEEVWEKLGKSGQGAESDPVTVSITRLSNDVAYAPTQSTWHIAQGRLNVATYFVEISSVGTTSVKSLPLETGSPTTLLGSSPCSSCHSVSNDGRKLLASYETGNPFPIRLTDLTTSPPTTGPDKLGAAATGTFSAFNPNGTRALVANDAATGTVSLSIYDLNDGSSLAANVLGDKCAEPAWSPDGSRIAAICDLTGGGWAFDSSSGTLRIGTLNADGFTVASSSDAVASTDGTAGRPSYPKFSSDSALVTYARTTAGSRSTGAGTLWLAATDGSFTKQLTVAGRGTSYYPAFAPRRAGGYHWITFTSKRNDFIDNGDRHLWVAAIKDPPSEADPSRPAFFVSGQVRTATTYEPNFAPLACADDGAVCRWGTDCCGGTCVPTMSGAAGTCGAPAAGACVTDGNRCNATTECCGTKLACVDHVCQSTKL